MHILKGTAVAALVTLLSACTTMGDSVARVAPDRTLGIAAPQTKVKTAVASLFTQKGFVIKQDSGFVLSFEHPSGDVMANVLLGSQFDPTVDNRAVFQFVGDNPTMVSWHTYIVTNPGTGAERLTETTNSANNDVVEQALEGIKAQLETKSGKAPTTRAPIAALPVAAAAPATSAGASSGF